MFKKLLKGFLFISLILLGTGVYFYFFPRYPDYNIPESYFETRFQKEGFQSEKNGFHEWKKLVESLNQHEEIITEFNTYYRCYLQNICVGKLSRLSEDQKQNELKRFLQDSEKMKEFGNIISDFFGEFERITQNYEFISTLDNLHYKEGDFPTRTKLIESKVLGFFLGIGFYSKYIEDQNETISALTFVNKYLSWLSYRLDDSESGYGFIIDLYEFYFGFITNQYKFFPSSVNNELKLSIENYPISNSMIQNGMKEQYQHSKKVIIYHYYTTSQKSFKKNPIPFFYDRILGKEYNINILNYFYNNNSANLDYKVLENRDNTDLKNQKRMLFFDLKETLNLMKKLYYSKIEGNCEYTKIEPNGENWIGRTLIQGWLFCTQPQYNDQSNLLQKRLDVIELLSN